MHNISCLFFSFSSLYTHWKYESLEDPYMTLFLHQILENCSSKYEGGVTLKNNGILDWQFCGNDEVFNKIKTNDPPSDTYCWKTVLMHRLSKKKFQKDKDSSISEYMRVVFVENYLVWTNYSQTNTKPYACTNCAKRFPTKTQATLVQAARCTVYMHCLSGFDKSYIFCHRRRNHPSTNQDPQLKHPLQ